MLTTLATMLFEIAPIEAIESLVKLFSELLFVGCAKLFIMSIGIPPTIMLLCSMSRCRTSLVRPGFLRRIIGSDNSEFSLCFSVPLRC